MTQYERIRSVIIQTLKDLEHGPRQRGEREGHASYALRREDFYERKGELLLYCINALAHYSTAEADVFLFRWKEIRK